MEQEFSVTDILIYAALNAYEFVTDQLTKYNLDAHSPSSLIPIIVSLISLYFTVISLWRTTRLAIWLVFTILKWTFILWSVGSLIGLYLSGGKVFGWAPVVQSVISQGLQQLGWDQAKVDVDREGLRVNGVPFNVPEDYHQYGEAFNKFKSRSKKKPASSRGIFDRFDSFGSPSSSKKRTQKQRGSSSDPASLTERIIGNVLEFHPSEVWQSVEALKAEFHESMNSIKESLDIPEGADDVTRDKSWWTAWWDDEPEESEKSRKRAKRQV